MSDPALDRIRSQIREIHDFPKPGIIYKDITPLLLDDRAFGDVIDRMIVMVKEESIHKVAAPEARGFIFGASIALHIGCGFIPIRKLGKLPHETTTVTYDLEYGQDTISMHVDALDAGDRVLLVDDVLATGGTMRACGELVEQRGAVVSSCLFFLELAALGGRDRLKDYQVRSLIRD